MLKERMWLIAIITVHYIYILFIYYNKEKSKTLLLPQLSLISIVITLLQADFSKKDNYEIYNHRR
jgi:hypothetical protein